MFERGIRMVLLTLARVLWGLLMAAGLFLTVKTHFLLHLFTLHLRGRHVLYVAALALTSVAAFRPVLTARLAAWLRRRWIFVGVQGLIAAAALEVLTRLLCPASLFPTYDEVQATQQVIAEGRKKERMVDLYQAGDFCDHMLKPNLHVTVADKVNALEYPVETNTEGWRSHLPDGRPHKIMFLGDSHVYGFGVLQDQRFASLLENALPKDWQVLDYGVPGWCAAEEYLTYRKYAPRVRPDLVILAVTPVNDFEELSYCSWEGQHEGRLPSGRLVYRGGPSQGWWHVSDLRYRIPILRNARGWVLLSQKWIRPVLDNFWELVEPEHTQEGCENCTARVLETIAKESRLLILFIPSRIEYWGNRHPKPFIDEVRRRIPGCELIDFYPILEPVRNEAFLPDAMHLTAEGNRRVAEEVLRCLAERKLLSGDPAQLGR